LGMGKGCRGHLGSEEGALNVTKCYILLRFQAFLPLIG
jgi:hypothetical protein